MRNKTARWIFISMLFLGGLLCSSADTMAFHSPIQDVQYSLVQNSSDQFTLTIWGYDPQRAGNVQTVYNISYTYGPPTVINSDGVVAWYYETENPNPPHNHGWDIHTVVYDPARGQWQGTYDTIGLKPDDHCDATNKDGVVAWNCDIDQQLPGEHAWGMHAVVYDPARGQWQEQSGGSGILKPDDYCKAFNKDGVIAWYCYQKRSLNLSFGWDIRAAVYDPAWGQWRDITTGESSSEYRAFDMSIIDATPQYTFNGANHMIGYYNSLWQLGVKTKPFSYFVASPTSGMPPLFVWFTDMSIGATSWNWNFDDGGASAQRSTYHRFTSNGVFDVQQTVSGLGGPPHASTQQISVGPFYTLTVAKAGTGAGTVTSTPSGINCGTDCNESYPGGTMVTLTANPGANSIFTGWSGGCSGTGQCEITMDNNKTVTATFEPSAYYTLTVTKAGSGSGTVTSAPAGIACGTDCEESYGIGTSVTLTATPAANTHYVFLGWTGGGCSGTGPCTIIMNSDKTVTATFDLPPHYTLTVNKQGLGTGIVTSNPSGIDCGTDCDNQYEGGITVKLTAAPAAHCVFAGWSGGACTPAAGTAEDCTVIMDSNKTMTATFTREFAILHKDGAIWSSDNGWTTTTPPYYPNTAYAVDIEYRADGSYVILHKDGAIYDSASGWVTTAPPYYPGLDWAVDMKLVDSGYIILHRDGALWSSSAGWTTTAPPYYPGTDYARALEVRTDNNYVILHKDGAIYDSASGWVMTAPPYYPGLDWAVDIKLK